MPLSVGDKLGHYEVLSLLGQGGMGEVYKARDTTLKRDVALKVLPASFLRDTERMVRFQREAEVLASLDHPNVGPIYGIVDSEDSRGLVLALIEGPTLTDQIALGPLPLDDALSIAKQIIEGLEYAHDRGVVHRDLKPANIKITPEGVVKVLDFGLAKVLEDEPPKSSLANSPTMTLGHTRAGVILGTAAYMSPEQAIGRPVDRRSDVFSFGAVLFEMLTGKRAFNGASTPDVLEAVVKFDPDWAALPEGTPAYLRKLLERTLAKDRKERLQAIGEARIMLAKPQSEPASTLVAAAPSPARFGRSPWIVAAVLGVTTAVSVWAPWRSPQPVERPLVRLEVDLGADVSLVAQAYGDITLSPDGTRLVYNAAVAGGASRLYTRRLDQAKATELPGTQGAGSPFFSPDGQWVGFYAGNTLNKISVEGGAVVPLITDTGITGNAAWGDDGSVLLSGIVSSGLRRIPAAGGEPVKLTDLGNREIAHVEPQLLPGGRAVLFTVYQPDPNADKATIEAVSLADGKRKVVQRGGVSGHYLPSGHLIYVNRSTLFAVGFDPDKLETRGNPLPILDDVRFDPQTSIADLPFSRNGTLVYRRGSGGAASSQRTVQWIDAAGKRSPLTAKAGLYASFSLSPDAKRLALILTERGAPDLWVYDPQRDAMTRLTTGGATRQVAAWTPNGRYVLSTAVGKGMFWMRADGAGQPQQLLESKNLQVPWSFPADGKRLAYFELLGSGMQLFTVPVEDDGGQLKAGKPERFLESKFEAFLPAFSPDGRWLAYTTVESGRNEVNVRAFPPPSSSGRGGQGGKWQISNNGGTAAKWSRSSRELLYQEGDRIMAVSYTVTGETFVADKPHVKIEKLGGTSWDLAPDGRIAVLTPVETPQTPAAEHTVVFLQNFFDELRRKVPTGK